MGIAIRTSMNVSLTPELEHFVQSRVALNELQAKTRRGIAQADQGELLDGDTVFEEIRKLSARRRAKGK